NIGAGVLAALQSPQPPPTESILTALINEITNIPDHFILVLDDYHLIDAKPVDETLTFLLKHLPPQMHLVITTREDPRLPLARLRGRGQLTELRLADLRFTPAEAAEFLNQVMGLNLSEADIAALETRTEGWIAGLQLAAISMQGKTDAAGFIQSFTGSHRFVLDYLIEEVLHKQTENIQNFLLRTSILDRLCGSLCDDVLHDVSAAGEGIDGQETLEHLERSNLFIVPLDHERRWYRYHHLFRDLLRQRLMHQVSPEEIARVHIRASEWLEASGDIAEAFHHALAVVDVDRAARLAESAWQAMNESFQMGAWLGWVNQLPLNVIRVRPVLCTQIGLAYMDTGNVNASESSLRDAEKCLDLPSSEMIVVEKGQFQTLPAQIAYVRAYNSLSQHRFSDAVRHAEIALDLIPNKDDFLYVQVATVLSSTHWANGNLDNACKLVDDWVEASKQAGKLFFAIAGAFGKADILSAQGRLREVQQTYQQALELASARHGEQYTAHHHLGLGMLYFEMGEDERAAQHMQKSFILGRQTTIVDWAYRKSFAQARLKESEGNLDSALDLLDEAQRFYVRTPTPDLRSVVAMKACIYLKQGNLSKAQEWAHKSGLSLRDAPDYLHEFERLTLARIALAEYQNDRNEQLWLDILGLLERQLKLAEKQNRLRSRIEILIMQALTFHAKGETANTLASLEQVLTLAEPEGYLRIFTAEGRPMAEMLSKLNDKSLKPYAKRILTLLEPHNGGLSSPVISQPLIEPLSERELEVLRLIAQGFSNQEITQKLFVALSTVKGHNLRIFAKSQVKSRTEAVARARELDLL
ncbi:MAG TPA: LuxR C-terminal-related transcriptional regulator, partial [Anaerolineales bacterium]|nr:LuxR C-terminal-related transcriptional regulator [Anaerolineales bacterium]